MSYTEDAIDIEQKFPWAIGVPLFRLLDNVSREQKRFIVDTVSMAEEEGIIALQRCSNWEQVQRIHNGFCDDLNHARPWRQVLCRFQLSLE